MQVVYYKDQLPSSITKSLFLAGPSLRPGQSGVSWRKEALHLLEQMNFDGTVFVPENQDGNFDENHDYSQTVEWEELMLNAADCIVFWIPRDENLPGFTTNVEFGKWNNSGKVVLGYPETAEKVKYLKYYADKLNIPTSNSLEETLQNAIDFIGNGAERAGGECMIPLFIWNTPQFQSWYNAQVHAGNRLDSAKVLFNFRPQNKDFVFLWVVHANMYVAAEDRYKTNEFVLARTDISSIVLWKRDLPIEYSEIVLVREYRTPASTPTGFILELPGGSSPGREDAATVAAEEIHQETGLYIDPERLTFHEARQLVGTFSSHKSHLFSVELTDEEMNWFKAQKDIVHGNVEESEQTYVTVMNLRQILKEQLTDWSTLGMIMSVVK